MEFDKIEFDLISRQISGFIQHFRFSIFYFRFFRLQWNNYEAMRQIQFGSARNYSDWRWIKSKRKNILLRAGSTEFIHIIRIGNDSYCMTHTSVEWVIRTDESSQIKEHDKVIYNKAIDKRSQKERAINIRLRIDKITEKREKGNHPSTACRKKQLSYFFRYCRRSEGIIWIYQKRQDSTW